jgi:predicted dithiol-disulfide oxidoreductase (DUF899 family)
VASLRRTLPLGGPVREDYRFAEVRQPGGVRLSELFGPVHQSLIIYSLMLAPGRRPCPSCSLIVDGLDVSAPHVSQRAALAVVAKAPPEEIAKVADERGWRHVRLLSSRENSFNRDYRAETEDGNQMPMLSVFRKVDGVVHHSWSSELLYAPCEPDQEPRHVDMIWPLWNLLDATPEGRGADFNPELSY